jgi:hypothetical protein
LTSFSDTQAVQPPQGEPEYLPDMVEDMHIGEESFEDLSKYDVWNRFLRVPLEVPNLEPELGEAHLKSEIPSFDHPMLIPPPAPFTLPSFLPPSG